jgi:two-component system, NarL family, invasion response regulator UvrY
LKRVLLVDDHPVIRQGIRRILTRAFENLFVGEADTGEQAVRRFETDEWDLVMLDISLPGASGLDVIGDLRRLRPAARIMVISVHPPQHFARRALAVGALGYLEKNAPPEEMVKAVTQVLAGRPYAPPGTAEGSLKGAGAKGLRHDALSDREYQVLRMIGMGKTVSEIAAELALSVKTVSTYRARILEKMELRTTAELMHYVIDNGLVP